MKTNESKISQVFIMIKKERGSLLRKKWLNDTHMSAVNKMMIAANFPVNGFQETVLAPIL